VHILEEGQLKNLKKSKMARKRFKPETRPRPATEYTPQTVTPREEITPQTVKDRRAKKWGEGNGVAKGVTTVMDKNWEGIKAKAKATGRKGKLQCRNLQTCFERGKNRG
jgi:hypothetical protein